jgi:threonine aldolase
MKTYDLRSDTVTLPSPAMRKAMHDAEVGDDVYSDDPSVNRLQEMAAEITGTEAALFVSSGSMGNLIPVYLNCGRGNELLIDSRGHIVQHELASCTAIAGAMPVTIPTPKGLLDVSLLEPRIQPDIYYCQRTGMVEVENTHNAAGGTYYSLSTLRDIAAFARRRHLAVHLDGARLFNASIASGASVRDISSCADTVTFCLSKGLGCPVGAMLCGRRDFIAEARRVRKMLGGGMRQVGIIAAAGVFALQNNIQRLAEDHDNARLIAGALAGTSWASLDPKDVPTNIIYFDTPGCDANGVVKALEKAGIRSGASSPSTIRFVTHLDISREDAKQVASIVGGLKLP